MDSERQDVGALRLFHEQHSRAILVEMTNKLAARLAARGGQTPTEGSSANETDDGFRRELYLFSKAWDRLGEQKKIMETEGLWKRLLDACYNAELQFLRQQGYPEKSAMRLVRREQAWWDPDSRQIVTGSAPPESRSSVPVVVVQREAGFRISDEILAHLWQHPLLIKDLSGSEVHSPSEAFKNTLGLVESMKQQYSFNQWEYFPSLEELDGSDRSALECILAGIELEFMLEPIEMGGSGFFEDEAPTPAEKLDWLREAKKGERLWVLLNAAVKLGQSLNHHTTFRDSNIEDAIRIMHTTGKKATEAGEAVERIISAATSDGLSRLTPQRLLKWLGGKRDPLTDENPLLVKHSLWGEELSGVTWERFENLVKSALRRLSTS